MIKTIKPFFAALKGTPLWVYAIFIYVIILGIKNLKTHTVFLYKLLILQIIFLIWGLYNLISKANSINEYGMWTFAVALGLLLSYLFFKTIKTSINLKTYEVIIEGNSSFLTLVLLIFFVKYFFGYTHATKGLQEYADLITKSEILFSGLITGLINGRSLVFIYTALQNITSR